MNKHQMKNFDYCYDKKTSKKDTEHEHTQSVMNNFNSFDKSDNIINNDSKTILSEEKSESLHNNYKMNNNKNYKNNYTSHNNVNYNNIKQKTIETVLENEGEENCSYNQNSENKIIENDPIVTFIFYKEDNTIDENKNIEKENIHSNNQNNINKEDNMNFIDNNNYKNEIKENANNNTKNDFYNSENNNEDKSLSLNLNNLKQQIENNNNNNINNNQNLFNINELIDNISQSEIFANLNGKKDKSIFSLENFNLNNNKDINEIKEKNNKNKYNDDNKENLGEVLNNQSVKYNVMFSEIVEACPIIQLSADTSKNIIVKMPRWITVQDFKTYLSIIKQGIEYNSVFTYNKLLLLSDFFENNDFVEKLVKDHIVPNFDYSNVIDYLENSYLKLSSSKENSLPVNISWFELFIKAIDFVSKNFVFYLNSENTEFLEKLSGLNKKILEELLDKSIEQIISNPFVFDDEVFNSQILNNISQSNLFSENIKFIRHEIFEKLIDFLHNLRNTENIFDLLMNEYLRISSDENVHEVNNLPNPTLSIDIPVEINNYYKEFTLDLNIHNRSVVFIVYYKKSDDSLNVYFKLNNIESENNNLNDEFNKYNSKFESNKNYWDILSSINSVFGNNNSKSKSNKKNQSTIKSNNNKNKNSAKVETENIKIINDEINLNEECEDLCQAIDWQNVSTELILEVLMKYPKIIKNCKLEKIFEQSLQINLINSLQRDNSLINNFYNPNNYNNGNNLNKRLIDESVNGAVSIIFNNLLKVGSSLNYSNNYIQIQKFSRMNSMNIGGYSYKSNIGYSKDAPYYFNTDANYEKNNYYPGDSDTKKNKISSRNKNKGNFTSTSKSNNFSELNNNKIYSKSVDPNDELNNNIVNTSPNINNNKKINKINHFEQEENQRYIHTEEGNYYNQEEFYNKKNLKNLKLSSEFSNKKNLEDIEINEVQDGYLKETNYNLNNNNDINIISNNKNNIKNKNYSINKSGNNNFSDNITFKQIEGREIKEKSIVNKSLNENNNNHPYKTEENCSLDNINNKVNETKLSKNFSEYKNQLINDTTNKLENTLDSNSNVKFEKTSTSNVDNLLVPQENVVTCNLIKKTKSEAAKISSHDSNNHYLDSEYSYFSRDNVIHKHENKNRKMSDNLTVGIKMNISKNSISHFTSYKEHHNNLNMNNNNINTENSKKNNLQSIIDEEKTLEDNYNKNEEKQIFNTFNNVIQIFENQENCNVDNNNSFIHQLDEKNKIIIISNNKNNDTSGNNSNINYDQNNKKINFDLLKDFKIKELSHTMNNNIITRNVHSIINPKIFENCKYQGITKPKNNKSFEKNIESQKINLSKKKIQNNTVINPISNNPNYESTTANNTNTLNQIINSSSISNFLANNTNTNIIIHKNDKSDFSTYKNTNTSIGNNNTKNSSHNNISNSEINNKMKKNKSVMNSIKKNKSNDMFKSDSDLARSYNDMENTDNNLVKNKIFFGLDNSKNIEITHTQANINENKNSNILKSKFGVDISNNNLAGIKNKNNKEIFNVFNNISFKPKNIGEIASSSNITNFLKNRVERKHMINNTIKKNNTTSLLEFSNNNNNNNSNISILNNKNNNTNSNIISGNNVNNSISANLNNFIESKKNTNLSINTNSSESNVINVKNSYNYMNSTSKNKMINANSKKINSISLLSSNNNGLNNNNIKSNDFSNCIEKEFENLKVKTTTNKSKPQINFNLNENYNSNNTKNNSSNKDFRNSVNKFSVSNSQTLLNFFNKKSSSNNCSNVNSSINKKK